MNEWITKYYNTLNDIMIDIILASLQHKHDINSDCLQWKQKTITVCIIAPLINTCKKGAIDHKQYM